MAIKKSHVFNNIEVDNAYIRISHISGTKELIKVTIQYSKDKNSPYYHVESYEFEPDLVDGRVNFIRQAYIYIKTLDKFTGSTDV